VTLQYFPFDGLSLFVSRAQGFKSGGFNNLSFSSRDLEVGPEESVSWEAGARGRMFDERLSYGATLFQTDVDDFQLQNIIGVQVQVRNAASARSRGLEFDFQWRTPWRPLSLRGAGALTDARFVDFTNAPAPASSTANVQDLSGRRMPFVPKVQLSATPEVRLPIRLPSFSFAERFLPPTLVLRAALDVLYRSSQFLDYDLDPGTRQDGYVLLDGRISLSADESWSFAIALENITDADVFEFMVDSPAFPGGFVGGQEFQRRFTAELRYRF
jgi:outer membrane receptor protein involved in Fe transport